MMDSTDERARIRAAVRNARQGTGLRALARQVGVTATSIQNFVDGANPHPKTWTKLQAWFVQHGDAAERAGEDAARAAVSLLAQGVAPELRGAFREGLAELVGSMYGEAGLPVPAWVEVEAREAHAAARERRGARFATVDVAGAEPVVLVRAPFDGDPRAVVEALGVERGVWSGNHYYPPHRINRVRLGGE